MKLLRLCTLLMLFGLSGQAQDADFSQYYATPLSLNPALTGTLPLIEQNTNSLTASFAFHKSLSQFTNQYLSIGFETGLIQKNINYENLFFEDQFNNINAFEGQTIEELQSNNFAVVDFGFGLNYSTEFNPSHALYLGVTGKHLSTPNVSFWKKSESNDPDLVKINRIPLLIGVQASTKNKLNYRVSIYPRIIAQLQGPHLQIFTGSTLRYDLLTIKKTAFHVGAFMRASNSVNSIGIAHLTPFVGFEVNNMLLGMSYDINMRDVANKLQGLGAFEISVSYTGEVLEDSAFCPQF